MANDAVDGWTERHENELAFLRRKRRALQCEAYSHGHLADGEIDPALAAEAASAEADQAASRKRRAGERNRQAVQVAGGGPQATERWQGLPTHVDPALLSNKSLCDSMRLRSMERVDDLADAAVFVVPDVAAAPSLVNWTVEIKGGAVVTPDVLTLQRPGPIASYQAATSIRRKLFISDRFRAAFPEETRLVEACARGSAWSFLATVDAFEAAKVEAIRKKNSASVIGVFADVEIAAAAALSALIRKHMFNRSTLLDFVRRIDMARSNLGCRQ